MIIFLSWLVNCVVPAKLGDLYRAYLLKINSTASLSKTFGTVFIERVLDVIAIALLGILAGYWSFRDGLPPAVQVVFAIGLGVVDPADRRAVHDAQLRSEDPDDPAAAASRHRAVRQVRGRRLRRPPLRQLPFLGTVTVLIWMTESLRLYFVVQALGFPDVELGLSGAVFVALIGSLLTAVPLSPAGLGIVEAGVVGVLTVAYGVPLPEATAIALLDRVISVFSVIVLGSIAYLFSKKPEGLDPILQPGETVAQVMQRPSVTAGADPAVIGPRTKVPGTAPTPAAPDPARPHRTVRSPYAGPRSTSSVPTGDTEARGPIR